MKVVIGLIVLIVAMACSTPTPTPTSTPTPTPTPTLPSVLAEAYQACEETLGRSLRALYDGREVSDAEWAVGREACGTARQVSQALLVESEEAKQAACGFIRFSDLAGDAAEARPCLTALRAGLSLLVSRQDHLDRLYPEEVIDEVAEEVVMPAYLDAMEAELDALEVYLDALDAGETDRVEEAARDYQAARGAVRDAWDAVLAAAAAQQLTPG